MRIRGGSGLGDALYLRVVAEHFVRAGHHVTALSDWPDVFEGSGAAVERFTRENVDVLAHYASYRQDQTSTQFQDMLRSARITDPVALRFEWSIKNGGLIEGLLEKAEGRPIVLVHGGREAFGRSDGLGAEMLPPPDAFGLALGGFRDCYTVRIGKGKRLYEIPVDWDLSDQTSVSDVLDLGKTADYVLAQCSFAVPLAECFGRPLLTIWASRGLSSRNAIISSVTPQKILTAPTSHYVVDHWDRDQIRKAVQAFRAASRARIAA